MPITDLIKRLTPRPLKEMVKEEIARRSGVPSLQWSLENLRRLGFEPKRVVDVGAYHGEWSLAAARIFPEASFLMIEAQKSKGPVLERIKQEHPSISYRIALLGENIREEVVFHEYEHALTASSMLQDHAGARTRQVKCRMETLDSVLAEEGFGEPRFIKIDVQGYELEVLKGASKALLPTVAVLLEVSLIDMYKGNPLLHEVVAFMHERGFQAYDVCSLMRRPLDQALIQMDVIFLKKDSPLLGQKIYG